MTEFEAILPVQETETPQIEGISGLNLVKQPVSKTSASDFGEKLKQYFEYTKAYGEINQ